MKNDDENSEVSVNYIAHVISKSVNVSIKYPKFKEFITYMNDTWIEGADEDKGPTFKISWWNDWYHMETRTTNTNEAYNYRIVVKLGKIAHPNIWVWVEFIQQEDLHMSITVEEIKQKKHFGRSRKQEIAKDLTIANAKCTYLESSRDFDSQSDLLKTLRSLCPKASFK